MNRLFTCMEIFLGLMVFTLPFTVLPVRYKLPVLGGSLPHIFLLFSLIFFFFTTLKNHEIKIWCKKYFIGFFFWCLFCLIWGCWKFPFYDSAIDESLRQSKMVMLAIKFFPILGDNISFLHLKMFLSYCWYMMKGFFFPFAGTFFIIAGVFQVGKVDELHKYLFRAVYSLSILMVLYSIPEVIWLWTGNETCAWILSIINVHLYDPILYNDWWPPLLWEGQLRSLCLEPSYFGIIAVFLVPFLTIDAKRRLRVWKLFLIFALIFMIFMTKARTAIVIYLGESIVLFLLSWLFCYRGWKKIFMIWAAITSVAFSMYLAGALLLCAGDNAMTLTKNYIDENVVSVVKKDQRSNSARFGNTIAMINIGIDYPLTGVGMGLHPPYMQDRIPNFSKNNTEIKNWIKDMHEKTFLDSGIPVLNEYAVIFACNGVPGLIMFCMPLLIIVKKCFKKINRLSDFELLVLLAALAGQMACMLSSEMFLTYPVTLWLVYCILEKKGKEWSKS